MKTFKDKDGEEYEVVCETVSRAQLDEFAEVCFRFGEKHGLKDTELVSVLECMSMEFQQVLGIRFGGAEPIMGNPEEMN